MRLPETADFARQSSLGAEYEADTFVCAHDDPRVGTTDEAASIR